MTVSSQDTVFQHVGNGVTTTFAYGCQIPTETDLEVYVDDVLQTTGYSITGVGSLTGGTVIFSVAPANLTQIRLERVIELERTTDYQQNGDFLAGVVNPDFDRIWMALQGHLSTLKRALVVPKTDTVLPNPLPGSAARANKLLSFDAFGQPVTVAPDAQSASALAILLASASGAANVGFDGQTVADYFKNKLQRTADTIAELKTFDKTKYTRARVRNYDSTVTGIDSFYYQDQADIVSADNGCTIIVANDGARWKLVHFGIIHIAQWGNNLSNAIDNMPAGGHLLLGAGPYIAKFDKTRSNLKVSGIGMPMYNGGGTALTGGTIIQGTFNLCGDNLHLEAFGVDCGSAVCTAINGGAGMDGLKVLDPSRTIRKQIVVRDVRVLLKDPTVAFHNFLFEGLDDCRFENLISRNGQWGCVMKTTNSTADGIISYNCSQAGYTFKSDTGVAGTPALRCNVSNVFIDNSGLSTAVQGILLYAATSSLADFTLTNYQTRGGDLGVSLLCDTRAVNVNLLRDVTLSNGIIEDAVSFGFKCFGAVTDVLVNNLDIRNTTSNKSIKVFSDCLGIEFNNVTCSAPSADPLNVDLAGRFAWSNLFSMVNGDYASPSGINIVPDGASLFKAGRYLGTLGISGVQTFTPAWTNLAEVPGGGTITHTGSFRIDGPFIEFEAQIAVTGAATTASTAASTRINNLPFQPVRNDVCTVISGTVTNGGTGLIQTGGQNCFTPTWAAYNGTMVIRGRYRFQTN